MAVTRTRGSARKAKKREPIPFGVKVLRLRVGPRNRFFSAHEDMLCARSTYFKDRFQKARKAIEGDCVICHQGLNALPDAITYCKTCGNNFHQTCMISWVHNNNTCPMCRTNWIKSPRTRYETLEELDADGFDVYIQWLYMQNIPIYAADNEDDGARCTRLIKAHIVGNVLKDAEFQQAIRSEIIEDSLEKDDMDPAVVVFAYNKTNGPCALRKFLIDLYVLRGNTEWCRISRLPRSVLIDLAQVLLDRFKLPEGQDITSFMAAAGHIEQDAEADEVDASVA